MSDFLGGSEREFGCGRNLEIVIFTNYLNHPAKRCSNRTLSPSPNPHT